MSIQAKIAIENKDGTIEASHCYESNIGLILYLYYDDIQKNRELISYGEISRLRENISPNQDEIHSFNYPIKNVCIFYHRDRGEDLIRYKYKNFDDFVKDTNSEYIYTFKEKNKKWYIYDEKLKKNKLLIKELLNTKLPEIAKNKLMLHLEKKKMEQFVKSINIKNTLKTKVKI